MTRKVFFEGSEVPDLMYYTNNPIFVINSSGHIVVGTPLGDYTNENNEVWVAVSHNYGNSFTEIQVCSTPFVTATYYYEVCVLEDSSGVFWLVAGYGRNTVPKSGKFVVYKSTNQGNSWSYINEIVLAAGKKADYTRFHIDGTDLYIGSTSEGKLYKSSDGGASFSAISDFSGASEGFLGVGANDGVICVAVFLANGVDAEIRRSTDGGANYTVVKTMYVADGYSGEVGQASAKFRISGNVWVYITWSLLKDTIKRLYLISYDNGLTWSERYADITRSENSWAVTYNGGSISGEPQVWSLP